MAVRFVGMTPVSLTAGTNVVMGASSIQCSSIMLQADPLNTNNVYYGDSTVTSTAGFSLAPGEKAVLTMDNAPGNNAYLTLASIYLGSDTTGNIVRAGYWRVN